MTTEKIRLWHTFEADIIRKGQRKPSRLVARAPIDLDIEAVGTSDLMVVGKVIEGNVSHARWGTTHNPKPTVYHGYAGKLWTPMKHEGSDAKVDVEAWRRIMTSNGEAVGSIARDPLMGAHSFHTGGHGFWSVSKPLEEIEGKLLADNRIESVAAARQAQENILLVDGVLWRRQPPPKWRIDQAGSGNYAISLCQGIDPYFEPVGGEALTNFQADRLDDARSWCGEHGRMRYRFPETFGPSGRVLEFDPEYAARDDLVLETCRIGSRTLQAVESQIGRMSVAGIEHYATAREAHARVLKENSVEDVPIFLEAVEGIAKDVKRFDYPLKETDPRANVLQAIEMLDLRIRRYEAAALAAVMEPPSIEIGTVPAA